MNYIQEFDEKESVKSVKKAPILAFVSIKGGVGKTTLAIETASALANHFGKRVLLVDGNFSAPTIGLYLDLTDKDRYDVTLHDALFGIGLHNAIYESHGFDVVPAALEYKNDIDVFRLEKILNKMRYRYDFIILDSSPNHEELKPIIAAADKVFVVTTPDEPTLITSLKAAKFARQQQTPVAGIIVNRIRSPKHEMNLDEIEKTSGIPVVARIKDHDKIAAATFNKEPMTLHDEENVISHEIKNFASALCGTPEKPRGFFQRLLPFRDLFKKEEVNREIMRQGMYEEQI